MENLRIWSLKQQIMFLSRVLCLVFVASLAPGCASEPASSGAPEVTGCTGEECDNAEGDNEEGESDDTGDEEPIGELESRNLIPFAGDFSEDINFAGPNNWDWHSNNILSFFGSVMEAWGVPTSIEASGTGIKMIHRFTSGELRFESRTNKGLFWANFISLPGTGILEGTPNGQVDMIFTSPGSAWYVPGAWVSRSYSLVRFKGTHSSGQLSGSLCLYTTAASDFGYEDENGNNILAPNRIGEVFLEASTAEQAGNLTWNTPAQADDLRTLIDCNPVGTGQYSSRCTDMANPDQNQRCIETLPFFNFDIEPVKRVMGTISGVNVEDIME